jgi:hypothetical protein
MPVRTVEQHAAHGRAITRAAGAALSRSQSAIRRCKSVMSLRAASLSTLARWIKARIAADLNWNSTFGPVSSRRAERHLLSPACLLAIRGEVQRPGNMPRSRKGYWSDLRDRRHRALSSVMT